MSFLSRDFPSPSSLDSSSESEHEEEDRKQIEKPADLGEIVIQFHEVSSDNLNFYNALINANILKIHDLVLEEKEIKKCLEENLNTDFGTFIRSEHKFSHTDKSILITEELLIHECLIILSGIKESLIFQYSGGKFNFSKKARLRYLNQELHDCLKLTKYYSEIVIKIENYIKISLDPENNTPHVYETFLECLLEYLQYFKKNLNRLGSILINKEKKFTLIDFMIALKEPQYCVLSFVDLFLKQFETDSGKQPCEKSINLLNLIYSCLIDLEDSRNKTKLDSKFLLWLFVRCLRPFLEYTDWFINEGKVLDTKHELGFRRNPRISIVNNLEYWKAGYELEAPMEKSDYLQSFPLIMKITTSSAFKIFKHMEILKLIGCFPIKADIYLSFVKSMNELFPFLIDKSDNEAIEGTINQETSSEKQLLTLCDINFNRLNFMSSGNKPLHKINKYDIVKIDSLFRDINDDEEPTISKYKTNLKKTTQEILYDCLIKHVNHCSNFLIETLFEKYKMPNFFEFVHSKYLFKNSEIMFIFSKRLFNTISSYETYTEDAILNNLYYNACSSVFTTDALAQKSVFNSKLITIHYDDTMQQSKIDFDTEMYNSSRLVKSIRLKIKTPWPLNMFVTQNDFKAYNKVFMFLMQVKQVKYDLDSLSFKEMDERFFKKGIKYDREAVNLMFIIRFKLINFTNTFHDLVSNQIFEDLDEFMDKLKTRKDIDEIVELHERLLIKLVKCCLLQNRQFQSSLTKIFNLTLEFCDTWKRGLPYFIENIKDRIIDIQRNLNIFFEFICRFFSGVLNKNQFVQFQTLIAVLRD